VTHFSRGCELQERIVAVDGSLHKTHTAAKEPT
jgi:hypothetical protein